MGTVPLPDKGRRVWKMSTLHSSFLSSVATRSKLSTCSVTACLPHWNIMKNLKLEVSWSTTFVVVSCLTLQISIWIPEASSSGTYDKGNWEGCLPDRKSAGIKRYKKRDVRGRQFTMQYSREVPSYPTWEWPNPKSPSKWKPFKPKSTTDMLAWTHSLEVPVWKGRMLYKDWW